MNASRQIGKGSITVLSRRRRGELLEEGPEVRWHHVVEAFTVVEHEPAVEHQASHAIGDRLGNLADDRSAVAVSDQHDVGQIMADDVVHD